MYKTLTLVFIVVLAMLKASCQTSDGYKVYALKIEESGTTLAKDIAVGATAKDSVRGCYMFWYLKGDAGRNILVDTGYLDPAEGSRKFVRPDSALLRINVSPADITDVIITHPHHDHIGGISLFTKAKFWMQKEDYDYFVGEAWQEKGFARGFNKTDLRNLVEINLQGRLKLVKGDSLEIIPGIRVFTGSKHTFESQYLLVNTISPTRKVLLASDAAWFYYNLSSLLPIPLFTFDPKAYVEAMKRIKRLTVGGGAIIPGHDDLVFSNYPKVAEWVVEIAR